jgi:hypothetical protein
MSLHKQQKSQVINRGQKRRMWNPSLRLRRGLVGKCRCVKMSLCISTAIVEDWFPESNQLVTNFRWWRYRNLLSNFYRYQFPILVWRIMSLAELHLLRVMQCREGPEETQTTRPARCRRTLVLITKVELLDLFLADVSVPVAIPGDVEEECCGLKKALDAVIIQRALNESLIKTVVVKNRRLVAKLQACPAQITGTNTPSERIASRARCPRFPRLRIPTTPRPLSCSRMRSRHTSRSHFSSTRRPGSFMWTRPDGRAGCGRRAVRFGGRGNPLRFSPPLY